MRRRRCEACGSRRLVDDTSAADTAVPATSSAAASAQRTDFEAAHEGTALLAAAAGAASNQAVGGRAKRKRPVVAGWLRQRKSKQPSSTTKNDATMTAIVERQSVRVRLTADYLLATQQCSPSSAASLDGNARAAPVVHQGKEDAQCTSAFLGGASGQRFASREYFPAEMPNSRCATNPISQGGIAAPFSPCDNDQATRIPPKAAHEGCSLREQVAAINTIVDAPRVLLPRVSRTTESDPSLRKENLALLCISLEDASQCPSESGVPFAETSALGTEPFAAQLDNSSPPNLSSPSFPRSNSCGGDVRVNDRGLRAESLPSPNQLAQNVSVAKESLTPAIGGDPDTKSEATTQSSGVVVEAPGTVTSITGFRCVPAKVTLPHESSLSSYSSVATQALAAKKKDFASMNLSLTKPPSGMLNDETHRSAADVLLVASHKNPPRDWGTEIHTGLETQQTYGNEQSRDDQSEKTGVAKSHQPPGDTGSLAVAAHRASTPPEHVGRSTGDAMGAGLCALALGTIPLGEEDEPENLSGSGDARDYPTGSKRSLHENVSPHYRFISAKTQNSTAMKKFRAMDRSDGCDFFYTPTTTQSQESLGRLSQQLDRTNSSSPAKLAVCDSASTAAHHTSPMRKLEQRAFGAPNVAQASSQLRSEHGAPSEKLPLPVAFTVPLPVAFTDSRRVDDRLCSTGRIGDANWSCDFERPSAMFQTGLGSRITIASASLARAVSIFGDSGGDFQVASIRSPVLPPTHPVVAFRTAGLKAALSVSAESMAKAEVISRRDLSAESSRRLSSQAQHTTEAALADKGGDDSHHTSILPAVEFHTAGLQTTISASAARLVLGEGLVADEDGETPSYKQTFVKATALPVVQGEKIAGCESAECSTALTSAVSVDLHNATEIASKANLYPAVFQAAGRSIAISAESMARADRIFAGRDGGDDSFQDFNDTVAPTTDAYLAQGAASDGSITFMTRRPCIAFRAGGRGAPISVSVESVANAKALFDSVRDPEVVVDLANQEKLTDCGCSSADSHPFSPRVCSETAGHVSAITESSVNLAGANRTINSNHMKQSSTITDTDIVSSPTIEKLFGSLSDENDITTTAVSACEAGKRVLREHPDFAGIQNTRVHTKARVSFGSAVKVDCRATFSDYEQSSSLRIQSLDSGAASPLSSLASASLAATSRDDLAYRHQTTIDYCDDQQFANTPVAGKNPDWRSSFRPFVTPGTVHCSRSQVSHLHRSPRTAERILGSQAPFDDIGVSELKRVKKSSCTMTEQDCRSADEVGRCANGSSKDEEAVATPFDPPDQIYPPTLRDAVASGFMVTKPVDCLRFGVSSTILSVTSINACGVRFDPFSLLPVSICDVDSADSVQVTGSLSDFRKAIVDFGCDDSSICARWLSNHVRWIIWKYASYERRFAPYLSGKCLTFKTVAHQLLHRYDREVRGGSRPAVRKVLNRDVSAHCMMILCVARIKRHSPSRKSEAKIGENDETVHVNDKYILELTDGWYSLPACPDTHLCAFIRNGTIKVGTKLLLSGAVLTGYDDGIDPLDRSFDPFKPGSSPVLQIAANSTRLARWDAKLGFVAPSIRNISHEGMLLVRRISDVLDGGGRVPLIDLRILHRYPLLYLGRHCGAEIGKARIFTEREEIARHEMQEKRRQNLAEKYSEEIEAECIEVSFRYYCLKGKRSHRIAQRTLPSRILTKALRMCGIAC